MSRRMVGIIQARMGSSRLPGKVLLPLAGRSVLGWVIRAARESRSLDDLVVATTTEALDDAVVAECERLGVAWHRGPVDDVLTRFVGALDGRTGGDGERSGDAVMRFTADCPLLDPLLIRTAVSTFRAVPGLDHLGTGIPRTLPRGLDVEIVSVEALRRLDRIAEDHHRAHVTSYAYTHPAEFTVMGLTFAPSAADLRVTLDTPEDWALIQAVVAKFGDAPVPRHELVRWLENNPDVRALNAEVRQKDLVEA